jgi:predicted 3-demethylubiquinone-9 3-methyltransferase (glyoxalase superfamily)
VPTITPNLWFSENAETAAEFYCSVFPDSRIRAVRRFENGGPDGDQEFLTVDFTILGQDVTLLEAGPHFKLDEAFSFLVSVDTQDEVDDLWAKLTADGGEPGPCGWLKDRFGVSWQIIPKLLDELLDDEDKERADAVMQAMLKMGKIDCAELQRAYDEPAKVA